MYGSKLRQSNHQDGGNSPAPAWRLLPLVRGWSLLLASASLLLAILRQEARLTGLRAEWAIWLAVLQIAGMSAAILACGRPASGREWRGLLAWNSLVIAVAMVFAFRASDVVLFWGLEAGVRLTVGGLWAFAVVAAPGVMVWLVRRRRGAARGSPLVVRSWFASVVFLAAAEPVAALLERPPPDEPLIGFPRNLPDPPDGEWHIAAIGGSTTAGSPYHPRFGIPPVVRWRLERAWSSSESAGGGASAERPRTIVVHNLAQMGHNLRLAARQLRELRYRPHVLLVYAGHNEFYHDLEELHPMRESPFSGLDRWLRRSPLFRVAQGVFAGQFMQQRLKHGASRRLIDAPMATAELARRRLARFRRQLEELAGFCERAGIATLWFVPAGSESGFDPNRSFVNENATADAQADVERLYSEARAHENAGRWSAAATVYRRGLERQPKFAEFHFRLGECLAAEGRLAEAGPHFALALEHDGHPIRATREYRRAIAEVAARRGIPCIDAAGVLRPHAAEGILDRTLFNDNVHPTLRGYFLLGIAAADRIASDRPDLFRPPSELPAPDFGAAVAELGVGVEELAAACEVTATGLEWLAGLRFDGSARLRVARQFSEWARRLRAGEIQPGEDGSESAGRPRIRPGAQ